MALAAGILAAVAPTAHASRVFPPPLGAKATSFLVEALRGAPLLPSETGVRSEPDGTLRTLELDDRTTLHIRLHIPF